MDTQVSDTKAITMSLKLQKKKKQTELAKTKPTKHQLEYFRSCNWFSLTQVHQNWSPLVSDDYSCVDGAGEGDVVEGVEQLGEDVGVQGGRVAQGPLPYWKMAIL